MPVLIAPGALAAARRRLPALATKPHHNHRANVTAAAAPNRRASSTSSSASSSPVQLAALHPSLLLDAACAACCVALLASAAARHATSSSFALSVSPTSSLSQEEHRQPHHQQRQRRSAAADPRLASAAFADGGDQPEAAASVARCGVATCPAHSPWAVEATAAAPPPPSPMAAATCGYAPGWAGEAVAACLLLVAASNAWFKLSGARRAAAQAGASTEGAARLARLESITDKQLAEFSAAVRQIDKLQVRTRLTSGDIRRPIAQLQSASADQSAVLVRLASEQEALRGQLRDTQALLAALQGLTAKQFQVTVDAIKQLRAAQAQTQAQVQQGK